MSKHYIQDCLQVCADWGLIPTEFRQCMTWEEQVLWLTKFLKEKVIPEFNGLSEQVNTLQTWFDNLDVQEEINNKLDEMAESGELADIIAQYLGLAGVLAYKTIADMAAAENLAAGSTARVLGNDSASDGNGAYYTIRTIINTDVPDGFNLVAITNDPTLVAERIFSAATTFPINVRYFGVKGDGTTDDTAAIQAIIDNNPKKTIYFPSGDYYIKTGIKVTHKNPVSFKLEDDARLFTDTNVTALIDLATDRDADDHFDIEGDPYKMKIEGGIIDCDHATYGIRTQSSGAHLILDGCRLDNVDYYGIYIDKDEYYNSSDADIRNVNIRGKDSKSANASTAIYLEGLDNKISDVNIFGTKIGVDCQSAGNYINLVHAVTYFGSDNTFTDAQFNATIAFKINGADNTFNNCYADTYAVGFYIYTDAHNTLNECITYWWQSPANAVTACIKYGDAVNQPATTITGCNFLTAAHGTKSIFDLASRGTYNLTLDNNSYDTTVDASDIAFDVALNKKSNNVIPFATPATQLAANSYFFLGYVKRDGFVTPSFDLSYAGAFKYSISLFYSSGGVAFHSVTWFNSTLDAQLVLGDATQIGNDYYAKLYLKTGSDSMWSQIALSNVCGDIHIVPYHSKDAVSAPTTTLTSMNLG